MIATEVEGREVGAVGKWLFYLLAVPWSVVLTLLTALLLWAGIWAWPFPFDPEIAAFRPAYAPFVPIEYVIHYVLVVAVAGFAAAPWLVRRWLRLRANRKA